MQDESLERFRGYLLVMAEMHMSLTMRGRLEPADIVQQTLLEACQKTDQNHDRPDAEIMAWLRVLLAHKIVDANRNLAAAKRDLSRERSLDAAMEASSKNLHAWLTAEHSSPSLRAARKEDELALTDALARLPASQREALILRHCQDYTLARIADHLGCNITTAAGFLKRGSKQLRELLSDRVTDVR